MVVRELGQVNNSRNLRQTNETASNSHGESNRQISTNISDGKMVIMFGRRGSTCGFIKEVGDVGVGVY